MTQIPSILAQPLIYKFIERKKGTLSRLAKMEDVSVSPRATECISKDNGSESKI